MATKDKKIALRLKKETSMTGTGASVTPGAGEGVATKYAFGKTNKVKPKGWEDAPSVPNRPSKAMDYKELWEGELKLGVKYDYKGDSGFISTGGSNDPKDWKFLGDKGKYPYLSVKADLVPSEKQPGKYDGAFDLGMGKGHHIDEAKEYKVGDVIHFKDGEDWKVMKVKDNINKLVIKPHNEKAKENNTSLEIDIDMDYVKKNINEGKMHIGTDTKTDSDILFEPKTGTFYINVIDAAGNRTNKLQVNTIDDVLAKFKPNWEWTKAGEAKFSDALDEATGFKSGKEFINIKLQKYPKALSKVNNLINMIGEDKFTMDVAEWVWDFFNNTGFEQPINEGYARFRNETKTRTKPEQFHTAVKEVKKKVNEINRLFEYMNRLQSELSESEGGLKYKKYTEKALQQIKESTKQLFFKSTKLK